MIHRTAQNALLRLAEQFPVIGITGPRQSGKSTLAKATFPNKRYVTLDDKNMRELAKANPSDFISAFPNGAIIDEAQKVPEIFDAIKLVVDKDTHQRGSNITAERMRFDFNCDHKLTDEEKQKIREEREKILKEYSEEMKKKQRP